MYINDNEENSMLINVKLPNQNIEKGDYVNYAQINSPYLNDRFIERGFYQVISPQTIFLKVFY